MTAREKRDYEESERRLQFDMTEAQDVFDRLSLTSVMLDDYLLVVRSSIDVTVGGEPYLALSLLLDTDTGQFFARAWNRTIMTGRALGKDDLSGVCDQLFNRGRPCMGCPDEEGGDAARGFLASHCPYPRKISRLCEDLLGKGAGADASACPECLKLAEEAKELKAEVKEDLADVDHNVDGEEMAFAHSEDDNEDGAETRHGKDEVKQSHQVTKSAGGNESLISGECKNEYVGDVEVEEIVIKPEMPDVDEFQEGGSTDYDEIDYQQNSDPFGVPRGYLAGAERKKYKCELCPFSSAKMGNWKKHVEAVHEKIKRFPCNHMNCTFAGSTKANLKSHIESVHMKKKDHFCPDCGRSFAKANALKIHFQGVHLKMKNFFCGECGRGFLQKQEMLRHQKRHETIRQQQRAEGIRHQQIT